MKKIMFNDYYGLTKAVLDGSKTQTRRIAKFHELDAQYLYKENWQIDGYVAQCFIDKYTPFKVGEIVAIAQSYKDAGIIHIPCEDDEFGCYDFPTNQTHGWNNKMFVRSNLMPNRIRITNVRVERLQDISDEDCIKEGVVEWVDYDYSAGEPPMAIEEYHIIRKENAHGIHHWSFNTPREAYAFLIDKVSGKGVWDSNPYVFVYDFELVK